VAGVPLTCGTTAYNLSSSQPYPIPPIDAPVVSRVLEAGGRVEGLATCENYCISLASFTSATGPVDNPWLEGYSAGGSSGGCAALLVMKTMRSWRERRGLSVEGIGEGVDFAIGGDQAGSIRAVSLPFYVPSYCVG
jgi:amidase